MLSIRTFEPKLSNSIDTEPIRCFLRANLALEKLVVLTNTVSQVAELVVLTIV